MQPKELSGSFRTVSQEPFHLERYLVWPRALGKLLTEDLCHDFGSPLYRLRVRMGAFTICDTLPELNERMRAAVQTPGVVRVIVDCATRDVRAALQVGGAVFEEADKRLYLHENDYFPLDVIAMLQVPERSILRLYNQPKDSRKYPAGLSMGGKMLTAQERKAYWAACRKEKEMVDQSNLENPLLGFE